MSQRKPRPGQAPGITPPRTAAWMDNAECRWHDPELFYPPEGRRADPLAERIAKSICRTCPVTLECAAEFWSDQWAIIAGMTPEEREHANQKR